MAAKVFTFHIVYEESEEKTWNGVKAEDIRISLRAQVAVSLMKWQWESYK